MLQKHSRWITRFLILLSMLMMISPLYADDDDPIVTVQYSLREGDSLAPQANVVFESVTQNLQALDIMVQFERTDPLASDASTRDSLIRFFSDDLMAFSYNVNIMATTSPMLVDDHFPIFFSLLCSRCDTNENDYYIVDKLTGLLLYITRHYDLAESVLLDVIDNDITSESLGNVDTSYFLLGNINTVQGDYKEAERFYQLVTYNIMNASVNLAWVLLQRGEIERAFEVIEAQLDFAITSEDRLSQIFLMRSRAWLYALAFDYDNAIDDMDTAISIAENNDVTRLLLPELYTTRGEIVFLIYEWDRVEDNFDMAIELDPEYAPAYFQRGILFYTVTRREDAQADFEMYLELAPEGIYAAQAISYIESIEIELEALGN